MSYDTVYVMASIMLWRMRWDGGCMSWHGICNGEYYAMADAMG